MNHQRTVINTIMAATVLVSLFAVVSSAASVSGTVMAGTGPAASTTEVHGPTGYGGFVDYFAVDTSGALWHTNGSGTWDSLGGVSTSSPAAVSPYGTSYYRLDVFVRGSNGALYWKYCQNGWSSWQSLGGQLAAGTGPAVASWSAGRLDVFVAGTNGALYHKWYSGGAWSGWQNLGGKLTASPAATFDVAMSPASENIWVFVRGTDGAVWQKYYLNGWSSWTSLGGQVAPNTGPAVSQDLTLFVRGTDHQLWHKSYFGGGLGWTAWTGLSGQPPETLSTASPGAVLLPNDHSMVGVSSTNGNVWCSSDVLANYQTWDSVGSPP